MSELDASVPAHSPGRENGSLEKNILYDLLLTVEWPEITSILVIVQFSLYMVSSVPQFFGYHLEYRKGALLFMEKNCKQCTWYVLIDTEIK